MLAKSRNITGGMPQLLVLGDAIDSQEASPAYVHVRGTKTHIRDRKCRHFGAEGDENLHTGCENGRKKFARIRTVEL